MALGSNLSSDVKDLLKRILKINPEERPKIKDIENHPWIHREVIKNNLAKMHQYQRQAKKQSSEDNHVLCNNYIDRPAVSDKNRDIFRQMKLKDILNQG